MRYLIDTNIFIWWLQDNKRLKKSIRKVIEDKKSQILVSVVSGVEISIKSRTKKLKLATEFEKLFEIASFEVLDINLNHTFELNKLPIHKDHKDPFDRILISQAKVENLTLITSDQKIWKYKISLLKA